MAPDPIPVSHSPGRLAAALAQLLASRPELGDGPARPQLSTIARAGRQLACLVNDLTELRLLDAGRLALQREVVDVATAVAAVLSLLEPQARQMAVAVGCAGDGALRLRGTLCVCSSC